MYCGHDAPPPKRGLEGTINQPERPIWCCGGCWWKGYSSAFPLLVASRRSVLRLLPFQKFRHPCGDRYVANKFFWHFEQSYRSICEAWDSWRLAPRSQQ